MTHTVLSYEINLDALELPWKIVETPMICIDCVTRTNTLVVAQNGVVVVAASHYENEAEVALLRRIVEDHNKALPPPPEAPPPAQPDLFGTP